MTDMTTTLTITRGLPGSGKTTWAKQQVGAVRVNRDELRLMLFGGWQQTQDTPDGEQIVTSAQFGAARDLLERDTSVIIDDTNLNRSVVIRWWTMARIMPVKLEIRDFTRIPAYLCMIRDSLRPESVGTAVIQGMHDRYFPLAQLPARLLETVTIHDMSKWTPEAV